MSTATATPGPASTTHGSLEAQLPTAGWPLWRRQIQGIVRLELRKNLLGRRALPLLLLAFLPVGALALFVSAALSMGASDDLEAAKVFAVVYRLYFLKVGIFLSCLVTFIQLFRGDLLDRSLHYYLLCPVDRRVLVVAKFVVGLVATSLVLGASVFASYVILHVPFGGADGLRPATLASYLLVTVLGCIGYGSLFMLSGLFFKNPVLPPVGLFLWELASPFLPGLLKQLTVIQYLISLLPYPTGNNTFEILASKTSPILAIPGLLVLTAAAVWLAGWRLGRLEIHYSED